MKNEHSVKYHASPSEFPLWMMCISSYSINHLALYLSQKKIIKFFVKAINLTMVWELFQIYGAEITRNCVWKSKNRK